MAVMTETQVRLALKNADLAATTEFAVPEGTVVTPAAKAWLVDQRIDLIVGERRESNLPQPGPEPVPRPKRPPEQAWTPPGSGSGQGLLDAFRREQGLVGAAGSAESAQAAGSAPASALPEFVKPDHFDLADGGRVAEKPEHLTALAGNVLVEKDHPGIRLRGQLDSLEAQTIAAQATLRRLGLEKGVADLADVLEAVKQIMRADVLGVPYSERLLLGLTADEVRHMSHHPDETFGFPHFFTSVDDGEAVVTLNLLRTKVREVELAAYEAYKRPGGPPARADIVQALNRLSSACYIMMFRAKAGWYR